VALERNEETGGQQGNEENRLTKAIEQTWQSTFWREALARSLKYLADRHAMVLQRPSKTMSNEPPSSFGYGVVKCYKKTLVRENFKL
jgi:hypothetical protein